MAPHLPAPAQRRQPWKVGIVRDAAEHGVSPSVMLTLEEGVRKLSAGQRVQWVLGAMRNRRGLGSIKASTALNLFAWG